MSEKNTAVPVTTENSPPPGTTFKQLSDKKSFAPPPGTRIEVYWVVEQENGQRDSLWWAATVSSTTSAPGEHCGEHVTTLQYESNAGFDACEERVIFMRGNELRDLTRKSDENEGVLTWRKEGEDADDRDGTVTMQEVVEAQGELDREVGVSAVDMGMSALATLPWERQMAMAQTYRAFAEHVKARLAKLKEEKGNGYEVSQQDVDGIFKELGKRPPPSSVGKVF